MHRLRGVDHSAFTIVTTRLGRACRAGSGDAELWLLPAPSSQSRRACQLVALVALVVSGELVSLALGTLGRLGSAKSPLCSLDFTRVRFDAARLRVWPRVGVSAAATQQPQWTSQMQHDSSWPLKISTGRRVEWDARARARAFSSKRESGHKPLQRLEIGRKP